jgi:hypothetical protein
MKILHYYTDDPQGMIAPYVAQLCEALERECRSDKTADAADALQRLGSLHYDILHLHGCWNNASWRVVRKAKAEGTRLVLSPHGQLEPWVVGDNYWQEKLPKKLLYQRRMVQQAYAVVLQGRMEEECMQKLGWNKRTAIIRNCIITRSISSQEMARQMSSLYRIVLDSNPFELMTDDTRHTLQQLIKTGITGDERWLAEPCVAITDDDQWRLLYCYARQEKIEHVIDRGLRLLRLNAPDIDVSQSQCFMPESYEAPQSIEQAIGLQFASENDRLMATFRHLRKLQQHRRLTIAHLIELDKELRQHDAVENELCERLQEHHLYPFTARLMQLTGDLTGLDEGFMPMPPLNDRTTRQMRRQIDNHLKI